MTQLIVPSSVCEALAGLKGPTEIRDENGKYLGCFEPSKYDSDWVLDGLTEEELERRLSEEPTGQTWADIKREFEAKSA